MGLAFFPRSGPPQGCWLNLAPPSEILMDPQGQEGKRGPPEGAPSSGGQGLLTGRGAVRGAAQVARDLSPTQQRQVSCEGDPPVIGPPSCERGRNTVTASREVWGHTPGPPDPSPGLVRAPFWLVQNAGLTPRTLGNGNSGVCWRGAGFQAPGKSPRTVTLAHLSPQ